ncbi:uncharacterized protein LOC134817512 [Bolinopsis microptera]|uniref:uncharacterized protein LOC134817512 n=1 Tax=Bolinopsis microptera TaxID=2820187 RepID=UPI0030794B46
MDDGAMKCESNGVNIILVMEKTVDRITIMNKGQVLHNQAFTDNDAFCRKPTKSIRTQVWNYGGSLDLGVFDNSTPREECAKYPDHWKVLFAGTDFPLESGESVTVRCAGGGSVTVTCISGETYDTSPDCESVKRNAQEWMTEKSLTDVDTENRGEIIYLLAGCRGKQLRKGKRTRLLQNELKTENLESLHQHPNTSTNTEAKPEERLQTVLEKVDLTRRSLE